MRVKKYHATNLGSFAPTEIADVEGYVTYHDSHRYADATEEQLAEWAASRLTAVRAAAVTEQAERCLAEWQRSN